MKTVSVLINCFNSEATLAATLDSALAQTYPALEVVIFDNGSRDRTPAIVARYQDARIRYHRCDSTVSLGEARNAIMKLAGGDYLAFLDSDDLWVPDKIACQVEQIERRGVGIVFTDATRRYVDDGGEIGHFEFMGHTPSHTDVFADQLRVYTVVNSSVLFRREALYRQESWVNPALRVCTDFDLFMRLIYCDGGDFLAQPLTVYNVAGTSTINSNQGVVADEMAGTIDNMIARWPAIEQQHPDALRMFHRNVAFQRAKSSWRNGDGATARQHLKKHLSSPRIALTYLATALPFSCVVRVWGSYQRYRRS